MKGCSDIGNRSIRESLGLIQVWYTENAVLLRINHKKATDLLNGTLKIHLNYIR